MRRTLSVFTVLLLAGLSACGGGGGGGGSDASPYTGLTTPAVITTSNADNIARQAFQGGDLAANATLAPARSDDVRTTAGKPMALTLVQLLSGAADAAFPRPIAVRAPLPRSSYTDWFPDEMGIGRVDFTLNMNDQTGAFTGTFLFTNYHGDSGGIINGSVAVSGSYDFAQDMITGIRFNFRSTHIVDGAEDVTAIGTVDLVSGTGGGSATLNIVFRDNTNAKTIKLSDYTVTVTDLGGDTEVQTSGRIYLHDFGYVDVSTVAPFLYPALSTQPTSGVITLTGSNSCRARLTVVDATTYTVELDADGNDSYEWTVTHTW